MESAVIGLLVRLTFGLLLTLVAALVMQQVVRRLLKFQVTYWMALKAQLSAYIVNWVMGAIVSLIVMDSYRYGLPLTGNIVLVVAGLLIYAYILSVMIKSPEGHSIGIGNALGVVAVMTIIGALLAGIVFMLNILFL